MVRNAGIKFEVTHSRKKHTYDGTPHTDTLTPHRLSVWPQLSVLYLFDCLSAMLYNLEKIIQSIINGMELGEIK